MQGQHVHGPGPSMAGQISFASKVTGLDRRIDPGVPQRLGVPNGPGERNDAAEPNSLGDGNDFVDYSASPTVEVGGGGARPTCCAGAHSFETIIDKADDDLRPMIPLEEEEALAAWMMRTSSFRRRPGFCSVRTREPRGLQCLIFLKTTSKARSLLSCLLPSVCLRILPEKTLLLQLLERREGETASDRLIRELVKGAKRTCYYLNTRRLTFILPEQAASAELAYKMQFVSWYSSSTIVPSNHGER